MNKTKLLTVIFVLITSCYYLGIAQESPVKQPKLVVGIVVDQMRAEYLYRYQNNYGEGGFRRLMKEGFNCRNTLFNYVPTYTGPGHASVYTGTTPSVHGIVGNNWYERNSKTKVYCTQDDNVNGVGSSDDNKSKAGKMSPVRMLAPTVGTELKLFHQNRSKVIGISLKDRASILPAGHNADAAYWYENGNFISSTFYMKDLPAWVKEFNNRKLAEQYLSTDWNTLLPIKQYTNSRPDDSPRYEGLFKGETQPVFPHKLAELKDKNGGLNLLRATPFGSTITRELAEAAIKAENLGKDNWCDLLAISFSSPDYVGHQFGIDAIETEDTYIRLDKEIELLLNFLDKEVGKGNYLLFLTADHAAVRTPSLLKDEKIPSGYFPEKAFDDSLKNFSKRTFGENIVEHYINQQIYLRHDLIASKNLNKKEVHEKFIQYIYGFDGVADVWSEQDIRKPFAMKGEVESRVKAGYKASRCGDIIINFEPGWVEFHSTGTTHGAPYKYDTHVPLLFFGWNIRQGESWNTCYITDIAPTVSALLSIPFPGAANGNVINEVVKKP
jgi:predicted AlkP superfamily pyrophosphatase or phosphodiesterase